MTPPDRTTDLEDLFAAVVDEFTDRQARGERPTIDEYAARHPELAADLRAVLGMLPALGPPATPTPDPQSTTPLGRGDGPRPPELPGFAVERELGRGGMGVVYLARQAALNRPVALKMVLSGGHATAEERARFLAEAEVIARLSHPGVVQVHEFGTDPDGRPYFALEYLAGGSLADRLRDGPLAPAVAAGLVEPLARAVGYAHSAGVVHRDLKPANVLFDAAGNPKVTDFGLAKGGEAAAGLTATGAIMGTPSYMSPEQAAGRTADLGPAADVYSLGAVLYECLTGGPPFRGTSIFDTLTQVKTREPVAVRALQPAVPRDLETIALKCLQKEPGKRYAAAAELADDLRRFLDGRPIVARPVGPAERAGKWVRRNPVLAGLWAAGLLAVVAGVGVLVSLRYSGRLAAEKATAEGERDRADGEKREADRLRGLADEARGEADGHRARAEANARLANRFRYGADLNLVGQAWRDNQPALARSLLARHQAPAASGDDFRGFEWYHLARVTRGELAVLPNRSLLVESVAVRPDDGRVVWVGSDGEVTAADPAGAARPAAVLPRGGSARAALTADGRRAVLFRQGPVGTIEYETWDLDARRRVVRWQPGEAAGFVVLTAASGDGRLVAAGANRGDGAARLWEAATGRLVATVPVPKGQSPLSAAAVAVSHRGEVMVAAWPTAVTVWDVPEGRARWTLSVASTAAAVDPAGATVYVAQSLNNPPNRTFRLLAYDAARKGGTRVVCPLPDETHLLAVSPDGRMVAGANRGTGTVFVTNSAADPGGGNRPRVYQGHESGVFALAFSPTGDRLYTVGGARAGAGDQTVRAWDPAREPGEAARVSAAHAAYAVSPDLTATVRVQRVDGPPGGWTVAAGPVGGPARPLFELPDAPADFRPESAVKAVYSPDGRRLAVASAEDVRVVDPADGRPVGRFPGRSQPPPVFSPDGRRLAVGGVGGYTVWDLGSGAKVAVVPTTALAFSPSGRQIAVSPNADRRPIPAEVMVGDLDGGRPVAVPCRRPPAGVVFSPDGRRLAVTHYNDPSLTLVGVEPGSAVVELNGHSHGTPTGVAFSPDGGRLATAGEDGYLRLWDTATGQPTFAARVGSGRRVAFSPDGRRLAAHQPPAELVVLDATPPDGPLTPAP